MRQLGQSNARMIAQPRTKQALDPLWDPVLQDIYVDTRIEQQFRPGGFVLGQEWKCCIRPAFEGGKLSRRLPSP